MSIKGDEIKKFCYVHTMELLKRMKEIYMCTCEEIFNIYQKMKRARCKMFYMFLILTIKAMSRYAYEKTWKNIQQTIYN